MIPRTPANEAELVDRIFDIAGLDHDQNLDAKWVAGITLLAHVLRRENEVARERRLRGLEKDVREALTAIEKIGHAGGLQ
jgi:hypothetical protein